MHLNCGIMVNTKCYTSTKVGSANILTYQIYYCFIRKSTFKLCIAVLVSQCSVISVSCRKIHQRIKLSTNRIMFIQIEGCHSRTFHIFAYIYVFMVEFSFSINNVLHIQYRMRRPLICISKPLAFTFSFTLFSHCPQFRKRCDTNPFC